MADRWNIDLSDPHNAARLVSVFAIEPEATACWIANVVFDDYENLDLTLGLHLPTNMIIAIDKVSGERRPIPRLHQKLAEALRSRLLRN